MIGKVVDNYRITEKLGEGGMGTVYKAFDLKLERFIALKILNSSATLNPHFVERFKREARNHAKLIHPNIVPVYGFTDENNTLSIAMEYVEGETLEKHINRNGRLELPIALIICKQILTGIGYAHSKGFLHRDLKPSNIILSTEGNAKIMDFGISKSINETKTLTRTGTKLGTILYMSPEQIKAQEPTQQSDIYSIGLILYEMLYGKNPFDCGTEYQIMEAHLKINPPRLSSILNIHADLDKIIAKALNKNTARRYKAAEEFLSDIDKLLNGLSIRKKTSKPSKRINWRKIKYSFYAVFFLGLFITLFIYVYKTVSEVWENKTKEKVDKQIYTDSYKSNPNYVMKTSWEYLEPFTELNLNSILFINDSEGYIFGDSGAVFYSSDSGNIWKRIITPTNKNIYTAYHLNGKIYAAGAEGTILTAAVHDTVWNLIYSDERASLFDIFFLNNSNGFITGADGTLLKSTDNGNTWFKLPLGSDNILFTISFFDDKIGFAAGWDGELFKTEDSGNSWVKEKKLIDNYWRDLNFLDDEIGFITGGGGELFKTTNIGTTWEKVILKTSTPLTALKFHHQYGFIAGNKGEILISSNKGRTWSSTNTGKYINFKDLEITSDYVFVVGQNGAVIKSTIDK